jgi:hypothetical protein
MNRLALLAAAMIAASSALAAVAPAPALDSDFASAKRALQASRPTAFADGENTVDHLLGLLDDWDPNVRAAAAKALRDYAVADRRVSDRLAGIMENGNENLFVRKEAIKSLSPLAGRSADVRRRIIAVAQERNNSDIVRMIACKALYTTLFPGSDASDSRDALLSLLEENNERPAVKAGAAWGLFPDAATSRTQDALLRAANDEWLDADARAEAIKSLYFVLDQRRAVRDSLRSLADEGLTAMPARFAAVVVFHRLNRDNGVIDWLQDLAKNASPVQIRTAAILAQTPGLTEELARYFHYTQLGPRALDPLENE